jgi:hypothetical protein
VVTLVVATPLFGPTPLIVSSSPLGSASLALAPLAFLTLCVDQTMAVAQYSTRMRLIPRDMAGRAQSAYRLLLTVSQPIGLPLMGLGLQVWGVGHTILAAVATLMLAWALAFAEPAVRRAALGGVGPGGARAAVAGARWAALGPPSRLWSVDSWLDAVGDQRAPAFFTGTLRRREGWTATLTGPLAPGHTSAGGLDGGKGRGRSGRTATPSE